MIYITVKKLDFNDYEYLLKNPPYRQRVKIEILRYSDFSVESNIEGNLVNDSTNSLSVVRKNGIRRTVTFSLCNIMVNGVANNVPDIKNNFLSPRTIFKLFLGLADEDENIYFIPQGVFLLEKPDAISNFAQSQITINGIDLFALYDGSLGGEVGNTITIPSGTNIYDALILTLAKQKYPYSPILDSQYTNTKTPYIITIASGGLLSDILIQLAKAVSANIFFDINGRFVFSGDVLDSVKAPLWDFNTDDFIYQGATNTYNYANLYNEVIVQGSNINDVEGQVYAAMVKNTNMSSSTSEGNLGYRRMKFISDTNITSNDLCTKRANYELKRCIAEECDIALLCVPMYHLDVDSVITLTDPSINLKNERFLINSYTLPFNTGGQMSITAVSACDLEYTSN